MVLSDADLEEARMQFFADTGEDPDQAPVGDQAPAGDGGPAPDGDDWEYQEGGGRDLTLGAVGLLAITVFMAFL